MGTSPSRPRHALLLPASIGMGHQVLAASVGEATAVADWLDRRAVARIVPRLRVVVEKEQPSLVVSVFARPRLQWLG